MNTQTSSQGTQGERRLLVTGFERFGPHRVNPSALAARVLEQRSSRAELCVRALVLPVTYAGAAHVLRARVGAERPCAVLMLGLAAGETHLRVECDAYDETDATRADNAGSVRGGAQLVGAGPARVRARRASLDAVHDALVSAGAPVAFSSDPGRYVCNAAYFAALTTLPVPAVFVHVPSTRAVGGALADETLAAWLDAAAHALAQGFRGGSHAAPVARPFVAGARAPIG